MYYRVFGIGGGMGLPLSTAGRWACHWAQLEDWPACSKDTDA